MGKLYPDEPIPLLIQDCFDASFLGSLLRRDDSGIYEYDKKIIALFDFDSAGYSQWNSLNNFEEFASLKFVKKHKEKNVYALLLPCPENENIEKASI